MRPVDEIDLLASPVTGSIRRISADIWRIVVPNPSALTGPGTNTYVLGTQRPVVIVEIMGGYDIRTAPIEVRQRIGQTARLLVGMGYGARRVSAHDYLALPADRLAPCADRPETVCTRGWRGARPELRGRSLRVVFVTSNASTKGFSP